MGLKSKIRVFQLSFSFASHNSYVQNSLSSNFNSAFDEQSGRLMASLDSNRKQNKAVKTDFDFLPQRIDTRHLPSVSKGLTWIRSDYLSLNPFYPQLGLKSSKERRRRKIFVKPGPFLAIYICPIQRAVYYVKKSFSSLGFMCVFRQKKVRAFFKYLLLLSLAFSFPIILQKAYWRNF